MTLEGAKKALRKGPAESGVNRDAELMERLQRIRALLVEVREDLQAGAGEVVADADATAETAGDSEAAPVRRRAKPVVKIDESTGEELSDAGQAVAKRTVR